MQHASETSSHRYCAEEVIDNRGEGSKVMSITTRRRVAYGRVWGMKIELVEVDADAAIGQKSEYWLRVLSAHPLGPDDYKLGFQRFGEQEREELVDNIRWGLGYKFFVDLWAEDDEDREDHGFEQWWVFTKKEMNIGHNLD